MSPPKWRTKLDQELSYVSDFQHLDRQGWMDALATSRITSSNHDTVLALDWPHYCSDATEGCGGTTGWCYTFGGFQATVAHSRHVAMVDALATSDPKLFAEVVHEEVREHVKSGELPYPNLRYSGSGEMTMHHLPAITAIRDHGITLWGFTRNLRLAKRLIQEHISVILSIDSTTPERVLRQARDSDVPLAYTSLNVRDIPPSGTVVTFPLHRGGRVREVVDDSSLCPKVLYDFFEEVRPSGTCQIECQRCHNP